MPALRTMYPAPGTSLPLSSAIICSPIAIRRARSLSSSMRRDSAMPGWLGTITSKRPAMVTFAESRAPFSPMGSFTTCTTISSPSRTQSVIFGARSSSLKPGRSARQRASRAPRNPERSRPTSMNAACMPGRTRCTRPRMMLPMRLWPPRPPFFFSAPSSRPIVRSRKSSWSFPSSTIATRISPAPQLIRTSLFIFSNRNSSRRRLSQNGEAAAIK